MFVAAYPRRPWLIAVGAAGAAIVLELGQLIVPGRDAGAPDAIAKAVGGVSGVVFASACARLSRIGRAPAA